MDLLAPWFWSILGVLLMFPYRVMFCIFSSFLQYWLSIDYVLIWYWLKIQVLTSPSDIAKSKIRTFYSNRDYYVYSNHFITWRFMWYSFWSSDPQESNKIENRSSWIKNRTIIEAKKGHSLFPRSTPRGLTTNFGETMD